MPWDPDQYLRFASERALPFRHLLAAVDHLEPSTVVDLGCGPGGLTVTLLERWPEAQITGVDTSEEMIAHARRRALSGRLEFEVGDARSWCASTPADLILANASFHWIDNHRALFDHLLPLLAGDGVLAFQVPANHTESSHTLLGQLCSSNRWREWLEGLPHTGAHDPQWYLDELGARGLDVTAWRTTYYHSLEGKDPILEWVRGTTLRPILDRLPDNGHEEFLDGYGALQREAYPARDGRTIYPFNRTFVVVHNAEDQ